MAVSPRSRRRQQRRRRSRLASLMLLLASAVCFFSVYSLVSPQWLSNSLTHRGQDIEHFLTSFVSHSPDDNGAAIRKPKPWNEIMVELEGEVSARFTTTSNAPIKVQSCRRPKLAERCEKGKRNKRQSLVAYNPAPYERTWCTVKLPPNSVVTIETAPCPEPARVFSTDPPLNGTGMPAVQVVMEGIAEMFGDAGTASHENFPCDIPCQRIGGTDLVTSYMIQGTPFRFWYSMESAHYYPELEIDEYAYRSNRYFATTSFQSDIPLPYFSWAEYNITDPAIDYDSAIKSASFIASNCISNNAREEVVSELMKHTRVDSISECLHNAEPPKGMSRSDPKKKLMQAYLFHLAFENSQENDYITEKLWGALESGTLPVYYGAPNIKSHAPHHSIISWHDFNSSTKLAKYLDKVAADKTLYNSYHEWRKRPLDEWFQRKYNFTNTHSICRICRWAYTKRYGYGWDHDSQSVQDLVLSRNVQYDKNGLVTHPFREFWLRKPREELGWKRTVYEYDGVIDIYFETKTQHRGIKQAYRMETSVRGTFRTSSPLVLVLQNDRSRITILTSRDVKARSPSPGVVDLTLDPTLGFLRVRVIVEDVDTFHKDADKAVNYFAFYMTRDFFSPVEAFLVDGVSSTA